MTNSTRITSPQVTSVIDPTQGLINYVGDVKPYHTKILDVLVEYVYTERIDATVQESWKWQREVGSVGTTFANGTSPGITFKDGTTLQARALPYAASNPVVNIVTYDSVVGGSGYLSGVYKHVLLLGGTGTGAMANITVSNGVIKKLSGLQPGSGYAPGSAPIQVIDRLNPATAPYLNVPLLGGTGTGATANITVTQVGTVSSVVLTSGGTGYTPDNTLTVGGSISTYTSLVPGSGYASGTYTNVSLIGGTGVGATATVVILGGVASSVVLTSPGIGYLVNDVLTAFPATLGGTGTGFSITVASTIGTMFGTSVPTTGGISNGVVTFVEITNSGTGYTVGDVLTVPDAVISGPTGVATTAGSFVAGDTYVISTPGTTNFVAIGAPNNGVGTVFTATWGGAGDGIATTAPGVGFGVRVKSSDLHVATMISEILDVELALIFSDSISASLADIRPVGYGLDTYSTNVGGGFGTVPDPDGLSITTVGSDGTTYTVSGKEQNPALGSPTIGSDGFDLDLFDE